MNDIKHELAALNTTLSIDVRITYYVRSRYLLYVLSFPNGNIRYIIFIYYREDKPST